MPPDGVFVLSDVINPLLGARGAARVFGPQKGLDRDGVATAEAGLVHLVELVGRSGVRSHTPGAGAAGGTGFGLLIWGAELVPGAAAVAELTGLDAAIADADLVVTGEGSFDGQSAEGKVAAFVADLAGAHGVPVALVAGRIAPEADVSAFATSISLTDLAGSSTASLADPARWLRAAGARLAGRVS